MAAEAARLLSVNIEHQPPRTAAVSRPDEGAGLAGVVTALRMILFISAVVAALLIVVSGVFR